MQKQNLWLRTRWYPAVWVCVLLVLAVFAQPSRGNVIYVTTLNDTIGDPSGCSLKDAIAASKYRDNIVVAFDLAGTASLLSTQCTPGSGNDTIILPTGATLNVSLPLLFGNGVTLDSDNATGPTATPLITTTILLEGYGATIQLPPLDVPEGLRLFAIGSGGHLTIHNMTIRGYFARGGDGEAGGGGGMGAGGVAYVQTGGSLTVENCTLTGNSAVGGNGGGRGLGDTGGGGGGGGVGGFGGSVVGSPNNLDIVGSYTGVGGAGGGGSIGFGSTTYSDVTTGYFLGNDDGGGRRRDRVPQRRLLRRRIRLRGERRIGWSRYDWQFRKWRTMSRRWGRRRRRRCADREQRWRRGELWRGRWRRSLWRWKRRKRRFWRRRWCRLVWRVWRNPRR